MPPPGKLKYVASKLTGVKAGYQRGRTAICPDGTAVTGGGIHITGSSTSLSVADTSPYDGPDANSRRDDGWTSHANNASAARDTMRAFAICATEGSFKYVKSPPTIVGDGQQASAQADCPAGTRVTGGGMYHASISLTAEVASSEPVDTLADGDSNRDNAWLVYGNNDAGYPVEMNAWAVCAPFAAYEDRASSTAPVPNGGQGVGVILCPAHTTVTGGGVHVTGTSTQIEVNSTEPWDGDDANAKREDGWLAYANNDSGSPQTMTTYAICRY